MNKLVKQNIKSFITEILLLSIKNLFEPKVFKWIIATILLTMVSLLICLLAISYLLIKLLSPFISDIPFIGGYISEYLFFGILFTGILGSIVLFAPLATVVFSLFQEKIIKEIEFKYYPSINKEITPKAFTMLYAGVRILVWSIIINIILFPLSLIWGGSIFWFPVYILIIGFLITIEYSDAINLRRYNLSETKKLRSAFFGEYLISGVMGAILFFIPIINLFAAPYVSILMLHILNRERPLGPMADN